uniref:Uncharacterized protein n=1 Tax=Arundo donax TaxID=35708 RepID=A0A0A9HRJ0_ARUDO
MLITQLVRQCLFQCKVVQKWSHCRSTVGRSLVKLEVTKSFRIHSSEETSFRWRNTS